MTEQRPLIMQLRQAGLSELACQFAGFIARQDTTSNNAVLVAAAYLSDAVSRGDIALELSSLSNLPMTLLDIVPKDVRGWMDELRKSDWVGVEGDKAPLILTTSGRLYLYRYWHDEQQVNQMVSARLISSPVSDYVSLKRDFANWSHEQAGIDWQKVAVMMALSRQFSVISGGPGTGKTTVVVTLIRYLLNQYGELRIALAAPTGKAAMRLQQAVTDASISTCSAQTIHRLLGINENKEVGRYSRNQPLPVDVLIVDEASMIDITLMKVLMQSLSSSTKLVLIGDSDQLRSVESGTVLADLCRHGVAFSNTFQRQLKEVTDIDLPANFAGESILQDSLVLLQHSYRFGSDSVIGRLAQAIKHNEVKTVLDILSDDGVGWQQQLSIKHYQSQAIFLYHDFFDAVKQRQSAEQCLKLFEQSRILCALKQGIGSVEMVNMAIERYLSQQGWRTQHRFYHGRPILITQNDYRHGLFNGDTGLILFNEQGHLAACFLAVEGVRWLALNRLPAHDTAFAMTVHKSQGSEFEQVGVVLPDKVNPILDKALLYTAVTRSKRALNIMASEPILRHMLSLDKAGS